MGVCEDFRTTGAPWRHLQDWEEGPAVSAASDADAETTDADQWSRRPLLSTVPVEPALDLYGIEAQQPSPLQVRDAAFSHKPTHVTIVHSEPSGDCRQVKQWLMRMRSCGHRRPPWSMAAYLGHRDAHFIAALAEIVGHDPRTNNHIVVGRLRGAVPSDQWPRR